MQPGEQEVHVNCQIIHREYKAWPFHVKYDAHLTQTSNKYNDTTTIGQLRVVSVTLLLIYKTEHHDTE